MFGGWRQYFGNDRPLRLYALGFDMDELHLPARRLIGAQGALVGGKVGHPDIDLVGG